MKPQNYENHRKFHNIQFAHPAAFASRLPRSASQYISDLSATAAPAHQAVLTLNALEFRACVLECGGCDTAFGSDEASSSEESTPSKAVSRSACHRTPRPCGGSGGLWGAHGHFARLTSCEGSNFFLSGHGQRAGASHLARPAGGLRPDPIRRLSVARWRSRPRTGGFLSESLRAHDTSAPRRRRSDH